MSTLEKRDNLFILTLTNDNNVDNERRYLYPKLIPSIRSALATAKTQSTRGSVLITIAQGKFYSNGLLNPSLIASSSKDGHDRVLHGLAMFKALVADLISLPMPTIAVVTGHAAGGGLVLALCHDYVLMRRDRGVLYMSEVDVGMSMPRYGIEVIKTKAGDPNYRRDILLRGVKVKADEGVKMRLIDKVYDSLESVVEGGMRMGEELAKRKWDGEVYAEIRKSLYPELCTTLGLGFKVVVKPRL
ncbi:enoyl-CoA delta isomerase 2, peroxisomal-like [Rutidosis leptorrhynchoides]|uniref:enoyl-CoA delta isomerase 2, peroxisomal-like n=1 Tax=Rutidosis leptorrhynchoides TaxID=125765 RepID=UPI003A9A40E7